MAVGVVAAGPKRNWAETIVQSAGEEWVLSLCISTAGLLKKAVVGLADSTFL